MLLSRVLTGVIVVPILLSMAWDHGWWFLFGIYLTAIVGTLECLGMARQAGHRPLMPFGLLTALTLLLASTIANPSGLGAALGLPSPDRFLPTSLGVILLASLAVLLLRVNQQNTLTDWAVTLALPMYVAGLVQFFIPLRERIDGGPHFLTWPTLVMATSWACDMAAFFAGRAWGRVKLAPAISPAKSREGAIAGLVAASVVGGLFSFATGIDPLRMLGFGLAVGCGSVLGDLVESLIKRQCGVKDSGFIMPGHGGLLDRMDALIFSAATAHLYLQAAVGP